MINAEKLKQFFEQLRGKGNPTAQDIRNAAAATGNIAEILPDILAFAAGMGIDAASELADFTNVQEKARQEKTLQETAAILAEQSGALASETDPEKRRELIEGIHKAAASLGTEVLAIRNDAEIKSAAEILKATFPEIRWIIPGLIGDGLTMFNGAPKIGKSWFVLNLAIAAAMGGGFLGRLKSTKTDTLYLALEDTERRIQNRLKILKGPETDSLKITTHWRDSYVGLENYLKAHTGIGLVIIDTLARFAHIEDMNDYTMTTNAMVRLKQIADDLNIAIVLIHHAKKTGATGSGADWMESALGSTGLTGATDNTLFIGRNRSKENTENTATLYATGRDAADIKYTLKFDLDCGGWAITNTTNEKEGKKNNNTPIDYSKPRG